MSTTDSVFLIILSCILSLFFLIGIVLLVALLKLVGSIKHAVQKAEGVLDSVESVTDVLKDAEGKLAIFKLVRNIIKLTQRKHK